MQAWWNNKTSGTLCVTGASALVQHLTWWTKSLAGWLFASIVADDFTVSIRFAVNADELVVWLLRWLASVKSFND